MIIDSHTHIGGENIGFLMDEDLLIRTMDSRGIDKAIVSNGDSVEFGRKGKILAQDQQISQVDSLKRTIAFARAYPKRIYVQAWIKPTVDTISDEFIKLIEDNLDIVKAIKLHPYYNRVSPLNKKVKPYIELCEKYHLAFVCHTAVLPLSCRTFQLYLTAKKHPNINFIAVHMDLGSKNLIASKWISRQPNLYGDTAWVHCEQYKKALAICGPDKIMFGSDAPIAGENMFFLDHGCPSPYLAYFDGLVDTIGKENYKKLMYGNAEQIFNLKRERVL